ncbi:hypothetical protein DH2020_006673 [Rehmannia glutinosa]|uniref:Uncharacterized protein n=1 Tax=Rehmannia glutinosa TaxID=99300 RepID=A0ABR0XJJ7_REHGL
MEASLSEPENILGGPIDKNRIGNAYIDYADRWAGTYDHFWTSALISDETHNGIIANCNFSSEAPDSDACENYQIKPTQKKEISSYMTFMHHYAVPIPLLPSISSYDPCSDDYVFAYLNTPEVQKALHANITGLPGPWEDCNYDILGDWEDQPDTVLPVIKKLMASGISVWIYR